MSQLANSSYSTIKIKSPALGLGILFFYKLSKSQRLSKFGVKSLFLFFISINTHSQVQVSILKEQKIYSKHLKRDVIYDVILPPNYEKSNQSFKTLLMNDGQDLEALKMEKVLNKLYSSNEIEPLIVFAIRTNENRMKEYGTAKMADYKGRGNLAGKYNSFIIKEFIPKINSEFRIQNTELSFCGFSLGGLSAMDIVWNNPKVFSRVGVFSGSFWWRSKAYEDGYDDHNDRIMHVLVRNQSANEGQKFWFECGTDDEKDDRNGNGIIDSIDDTLDLIKELEAKGYKKEQDIVYYEVKGGQHNQKTWSEAMPVFLKWLSLK
jgi:predicted alpha/beta superfamily hydrolase